MAVTVIEEFVLPLAFSITNYMCVNSREKHGGTRCSLASCFSLSGSVGEITVKDKPIAIIMLVFKN